jgi:hypothetical protein
LKAEVRSALIVIGVLGVVLASCAKIPTPEEANDAVLALECGAKGQRLESYFHLSAAGGGTTQVLTQIGSQDFVTLARAMCDADRQAAMTTLAAEVAREVAQQSQHDRVMVEETRKSIVDLAQQKAWGAPAEDNYVQELICNAVRKLVEELSTKKKTKAKAA